MAHDEALDLERPAVLARAWRRRSRALARSGLRSSVRFLVQTRRGLTAVNRLHRALSLPQKRRFFYACFDLAGRVEGPWIVDFAGRQLVLPLHRDFPLSWMAAISFHGHDIEMHEMYETLVRGPRPPRVFYDVGASYGLHSLKLLAHGAHVVSFEPNTGCHPFFLACCDRNGLTADLRPVAVGAVCRRVELAIPNGQTWLGTTSVEVAQRWRHEAAVETRRVLQVTLDDVMKAEQLVPDVIKIDTEGSELAVLAGARTILEQARPLLLLESWPDIVERRRLFELLTDSGYRPFALQFGLPPSRALTLAEFLDSPATNFAARPIRSAAA